MKHSSDLVETGAPARTVFVTGATGLLGNNLVRQLVAQGYQVKALVRSLDKAHRYLADLPIELIQGDMGDVPAFAAALAGCSAVFHTAAYFREYYQPGDHQAELVRINVEGTLTLLRAADANGVRCFVHTSSSGAVGMGADGSAGDEDTPPHAAQLRNLYFRSKVEGDALIRAFAPRHGMRVVEVLPGWMWGPGDAAPTASGRVALDFLARKIPVLPEGGTNMVDARDVAAAMVRCLECAAHGSRFIVGGEFRTLAQVMGELETISSVPAPTQRLPFFLVYVFAWLQELRARLFGSPALITREALRTMRMQHRVSSLRAERELGVQFRPFSQTLGDVLQWYRAHGLAASG
jgi:dihydroflavonol-4-reductase